MACCFRETRSGRKKDTPRAISDQNANAVPVAEEELPSPARILPSCELVRLLGKGTFGSVVLIRERATGTLYAAKIMSKSHLQEEGQVNNIVTERQVLREAGPHPFVVECYSGFQTADAIVLVLEYLPGGDMYDLLSKYGCLNESQAQFYIAEILAGLQELHRHKVVFRDLKLENILIDERGHIRLTDFGLAAKVSPTAWAEHAIVDRSGTAMYQAPEVLAKAGHGQLVDFWALGVLTHVIFTGRPPFTSTSREELYAEIQIRDLDLDSDERLAHLSQSARDFIASLLQRDPAKRLGAGSPEGPGSIRAHPFLKNIDWEALVRREVAPPLPPPLDQLKELVCGSAVRGSTDFRRKSSSGCVTEAERAIREKLFPRTRVVLLPRTRSKRHSDFVDYRVVNSAGCSSTGRVSIGLDFCNFNTAAKMKTWTGANDDFGRPL